MKNFSLKTKRNSPHSSVRRAVLHIVLLTLGAICLIFFLRGVLGDVFSSITMRVHGVTNYFETSGAAFPSYIRDRSELHAEILALKQELAAQSGSSATIARFSHENDELRALLSNHIGERILAGVIARPPMVPYDLLILDQGSNEGVQVGATVYLASSHAIGVISKVFDTTSLVTLFSSAGAETTVYLYGPNVFAYAYGEGGGVIRISVPQGITLTEGDPVVLPSVEGNDIGVIERIVSTPAEPEQNAYVTFPVSLQSLRLVSVARDVTPQVSYEDLAPNVELIKARFRIDVPDAERMGTSTSTPTSTEAVSTTPPQ